MKSAEVKKAIIKEPGKKYACTMEPEEFQKSLEEELIFINGLENSQDRKLIGHRENLNIWEQTIKI